MPRDATMVDAALSMVTDPRREVELHRLVHDRVGQMLAEHGEPEFAPDVNLDVEELQQRVEGYEHLASDLATVAGASGYWSPEDQSGLWVSVIERLAGMRVASGRRDWLDLARYPALLVLYAVSIGAVARRRYGMLQAVLTRPTVTDVGRNEQVTDVLFPPAVLDAPLARKLSGQDRRKTPFNDHMHEVLRPWLVLPVPDDHAYDRAFDDFEYLFGLVALDVSEHEWAPVGRFGWKQGGLDPGAQLEAEVTRRGSRADFLMAGLFGGAPERFTDLRSRYAAVVSRSGLAW